MNSYDEQPPRVDVMVFIRRGEFRVPHRRDNVCLRCLLHPSHRKNTGRRRRGLGVGSGVSGHRGRRRGTGAGRNSRSGWTPKTMVGGLYRVVRCGDGVVVVRHAGTGQLNLGAVLRGSRPFCVRIRHGILQRDAAGLGPQSPIWGACPVGAGGAVISVD